MATVNLSLPQPLKDWIDAQVKEGHYQDANAYLHDLIERDRRARDALAAAIEEGMQSGASTLDALDIWEEVKAERAPA